MNAKMIVQMDDKKTRIFNTKVRRSRRNGAFHCLFFCFFIDIQLFD